MDNIKDSQLVFVNENGEEVICDILFTYHSEKFNKNYVFFIPVENINDDGTNDVACASYIVKGDSIGELYSVESNEEWKELSEVFNSFLLDAEEDNEKE